MKIEIKDFKAFMNETRIAVTARDGKIEIVKNNLDGDSAMQMLEAMAFMTTIVASREYEDNIRGITLMKSDIMDFCSAGIQNALEKLGEEE